MSISSFEAYSNPAIITILEILKSEIYPLISISPPLLLPPKRTSTRKPQ